MPKNNGKARKAWRKALADTRVNYWTEFDQRVHKSVTIAFWTEAQHALQTHLDLRSPRP